MERRTLLGISGGVLAGSLSGCLQLETNDDEPDGGSADVDDESDGRDEPEDDEDDDGVDEGDDDDAGEADDDADDADGNGDGDADDGETDDDGVTVEAGSPEAAVVSFVEALDAPDVQAANELLHPDGPMPEIPEEDADDFEDLDYAVEETELLEQADEEALVAVTLTVDDGESEDVFDSEIALRTDDGEWRVWEIDPDDGPPAPSVSLSTEAEREDGEVVSVTFRHEGGDAVEVDGLSVHAASEGAAPPGDGGTLVAGDRLVVEFDGEGNRIAAGGDVLLIWDPDSTLLTHHTLDDPTAGAPEDQFQVNP